jgi:uncharacterized RDD family membrane protein YckC
MMCPRCGEECHCEAGVRSDSAIGLQPRFQVDRKASVCLVDPEAFEPSEETFSASLMGVQNAQPPPRFVPDHDSGAIALTSTPSSSCEDGVIDRPERASTGDPRGSSRDSQSLLTDGGDTGEWRQEVAARLNQYRSRRKVKSPRYPSLRLKFDPPESTWSAHSPAEEECDRFPSVNGSNEAAYHATRSSVARVEQQERVESAPELRIEEVEPPVEPTAKIIEFPRSYLAPVPNDELAEPILSTPRILEAPEVVPPPPAMGGILIEPDPVREPERRPGIEIPLKTASLTRRLAAGVIDFLIVLISAAVFAYLVEKLVAPRLPIPRFAEAAAAVVAVFWVLYQYMLIVYNGSTPGLRTARLLLRRFDGSPVPRRVRRWRVITSVLSGLSLGMGYAWLFLDEDALSWHDRITRTYLEHQPKELKR